MDVLKKNPAWKVTIEGHTNSTSTAAHNLDLSKRRAEAVKAALVAGGIDAGFRPDQTGRAERDNSRPRPEPPR